MYVHTKSFGAYKCNCKLSFTLKKFRYRSISFQIYFNKYLEKYQQGLRQLERKKVKHEDWSLFQMCLTLMQTIGDYH